METLYEKKGVGVRRKRHNALLPEKIDLRAVPSFHEQYCQLSREVNEMCSTKELLQKYKKILRKTSAVNSALVKLGKRILLDFQPATLARPMFFLKKSFTA